MVKWYNGIMVTFKPTFPQTREFLEIQIDLIRIILDFRH